MSVFGRAANSQALAELVFTVLFVVIGCFRDVVPLFFVEYTLIIIKRCANGRAKFAMLRDAEMHVIKSLHCWEYIFTLGQKG